MIARRLYDKVWDSHLVRAETPDAPAILYVDTHLIHEVTSPQAFAALRERGLAVRRPERTVATADHSTPTTPPDESGAFRFANHAALRQVEQLARNCAEFGIELFDLGDERQGIVHVIGPELGLTQPGATIVCGDSHTATHGAFGALAFGIGTSEVGHVLATQCLLQRKTGTLQVRVDGQLQPGVTAKDLILAVIARIGVDGGIGRTIEYCGAAIDALSMEERMTVCNMSIEAGARAGMIAPDKTTFDYLRGRAFVPEGEAYDEAIERWEKLPGDRGAAYDRVEVFEAADVAPQITWGTNPGQVTSVTSAVPDPASFTTDHGRKSAEHALEYMDLSPGTPLLSLKLDRVFIGSCTNSRIEDLRAAARTAKGYHVAEGMHAMVVPGSASVKRQAEAEGLDQVFRAAGFDWREAGCSMCLGMNPDILSPGQRCASTSNRNFEGRQGKGGRTHLVSPAMAAAAAVTGHFVDVRDWEYREG